MSDMTNTAEKILEVKNIDTRFLIDGKSIRAVEDANLELHKGEIVGIVGESGSGKSVTMMSVMQLVSAPGKVCGGEVYVGGGSENILQYAPNSREMQQIRGGKIAMIFQEPMTSLNPVLTVGYQITEAIMLHMKLSKAEAKARAIQMLKEVGIPDAESRYGYYAQQFSGGMRQRIMIAMALASDPEILIADEATTALDVTTQAQLLDLMQDLARNRGIAIIIVTHNLGIVARYAQRIYVMYAGRMMETATTKQMFRHPLHPYTRGLLKAIPRLSDARDRVLIPIDGIAPNPAEKTERCPFYDRCQYRGEKCLKFASHLIEMEPGHFVSCALSMEEMDEKTRQLDAMEQRKAPVKQAYDEIVLDVDNVRKWFPVYKGLLQRKVGDVKAIENISFRVKKGETLGIVGESGCGKTTLARCIMRVYEPDEGSIVFEGKDIAHLKERELEPVRPKISMVFQDPFSSLDPRQTAAGIVGEPLQINHLVHNQAEFDRKITELFELVGLDPDMRDRVPHEFSGGQRQRLGIARALASNPSVIVCDEPISALDVSIQAQIINLLEDIQSKLGITYLFIAHDLAVVKHISDRILVMYLGKVVEISECEELYANPKHPYTQALLSAVPNADPDDDEQRTRIKLLGEVPSILKRPSGCPFSDRCQYATGKCHEQIPELKEFSPGHQVACHLV